MLGRETEEVDIDIVVPTNAIEIVKKIADNIGSKFIILDKKREVIIPTLVRKEMKNHSGFLLIKSFCGILHKEKHEKLSIDFIRKKKKNTFSINKTLKNDEGSELEIDLKSDALDPEQTYMREQKIQIMHDVVRKLKPRYRTLVELRYFKEYSYEEIADHLDIPLGTVKAQLFRAREFLYNIMKNTQEKI